jgi:hypothetical protein
MIINKIVNKTITGPQEAVGLFDMKVLCGYALLLSGTKKKALEFPKNIVESRYV